MKRVLLCTLTLLLALGVYAQNADNRWAIGIGAGGYLTSPVGDNANLPDKTWGFTPELYLSRFLSPSFDAYLKGNLGLWNNSMDVNSLDIGNFALNLRYKLFNDKILSSDAKVQPYLFAGPGMLFDHGTNAVNWNGGLGFKFPLSGMTSLYLEGGYIRGIDAQSTNRDRDDFLKGTIGLEFALGKAKDSDGDGVPDRKDKCPNTPKGVAVDKDGCPLDRDGDGVPDYLDECPDTPGLKEFNGCPDRDGDGVPDHKDDCPDVPGLKKFNGCPDSDGDGVPDNKDECPNTPPGCPVDAKGCPLDSDGDGVIDCQDDCPNEPGPKENKGCPVGLVKIDITPVYFDFDKADLKPEGKAELDKLASTLNAAKKYEIVVNGHTCSIGTETYNQKLSERRAQEVVKYLTMKGINNAYVGAKGYGETQPAQPNTSVANRKLNRRAEFDVKVQK